MSMQGVKLRVMRILHITPSLDPEWGGPTKVVFELTEALAKKGVRISIFAPLGNGVGKTLEKPDGVDLTLFPQGFLSRFWTSFSPPLGRACQREILNFDLVHIHEIWHHPHFAAYSAAKKARKPYIVTIHGALELWCLDHKALKKKIYATFIQKGILKQASGLHAMTEEEVDGISNFVDNKMDNKNIFVIPSGVDLGSFQKLPPHPGIEKVYPELNGKKVILFLGRLHPVKGIDILAKAFGAILNTRSDVHLMVCGPDSHGYKSSIERILKEDGALGNTTFTGMVSGLHKLAILFRADIFVLPSYSEGFSVSVLEAMACGLPVIITRQCNFIEVRTRGAGEVIEPSVPQLARSLSDLLAKPQVRKKMGEIGRQLVAEKFTWDKIADQMIEVYKGILSTRNGFRVIS